MGAYTYSRGSFLFSILCWWKGTHRFKGTDVQGNAVCQTCGMKAFYSWGN